MDRGSYLHFWSNARWCVTGGQNTAALHSPGGKEVTTYRGISVRWLIGCQGNQQKGMPLTAPLSS